MVDLKLTVLIFLQTNICKMHQAYSAQLHSAKFLCANCFAYLYSCVSYSAQLINQSNRKKNIKIEFFLMNMYAVLCALYVRFGIRFKVLNRSFSANIQPI